MEALSHCSHFSWLLQWGTLAAVVRLLCLRVFLLHDRCPGLASQGKDDGNFKGVRDAYKMMHIRRSGYLLKIVELCISTRLLLCRDPCRYANSFIGLRHEFNRMVGEAVVIRSVVDCSTIL